MIDEIISSKGLRLTNFRRQVLAVFIDQNKSLALSELESALGDHDRITLYRTIKSFIEKGIIHEIVMPGDVKKLALCNTSCGNHDGHHDHNHIHFHCTSCEEVFCVDIPEIPGIQLKDYQVDEYEIQAKGLCPDCRN